MAKMERIREAVSAPLDPAYLKQRAEAGWELVALEWQRQAEGPEPEGRGVAEDVPYGSRVARDCSYLAENPAEVEALTVMLEMIVQDRSMSMMADALNERGFRTRDGAKWTVVTVYNMLPRLIEVSPRILANRSWAERRKEALRLAGAQRGGR
jgi:hypothetical protein